MSHRSLFKKILFSLKVELQRGREREGDREILHQFVHSPNGFGGLGWVRPNPGAWNSIWVFHE